jgi:integrase/recombinase XerC
VQGRSDGVVVGGESAAEAALSRVFGVGVRPLRLEEALFEATLEGWRRQQAGRHLRGATVRARELVVRRFGERTGRWPWEWRAIDVDEWMEDLGAPPRGLAVSTLRSYQGALRAFMDYLSDERYPWLGICEQQFGVRPRQILFAENLIRRVADYEGDPARRPFSREELTLFFGFCDERVNRLRRLGRKGSLAALRDGALFKLLYGWGLRRQEAVRLDVNDFGPTRSGRRSGATAWSGSVTARPRAEVRRSGAACCRCSTGRWR